MSALQIILIILGALILLALIGGVIVNLMVADYVYKKMLVRTSPEKWSRSCSDPSVPEHLAMFNDGLAWGEAHKDCMKEVDITNDGFHLCGQYFDFGFKRAVIIVAGRTESCLYGYYFGQPYLEAGCNVLCIDIRSHGLSDGVYDYVGWGEHRDLLAWMRLLHDTYGNEQILVHGICMGAGTGFLALAEKDCPDYYVGQINEGCYISFPETFKQHAIGDGRPYWPVTPLVMHLIKKNTGNDVYKTAPINYIDKMTVPMLFIYGAGDAYSHKEKSEMLIAKCSSPVTEKICFEKGTHSHLRCSNTEAYDEAIRSFIHRNFDGAQTVTQ